MKKNKPIPKHFESAEEAGEFWDTHDLTDYLEKTTDVEMEFNLRKRHYYIAVSPSIAKELHKISEKQGISTETVVNLFLQEKLHPAHENI